MATDHPTWEELMGSGDWEGLLDPVLHSDLRNLILRCGNFSQATVDAFNNDEGSKYAGSSRYGKESFFEKVMLESASLYQAKAFLYASAYLAPNVKPRPDGSWDKDSNMIGYIAVTTDEVSKVLGRREIYVAWRGTVTEGEMENDLNFSLESAKELVDDDGIPDNVPQVMTGWLNIYTFKNSDSRFTYLSPREQLRKKIEELRRKDYKDEKLSIIVTGHSLGASLATLSAFDLVENDIKDKDIRVAAIVSASPRVGDEVFKQRVENNYPNLKVLRVKNIHDVVPNYPIAPPYADVGKELDIDNHKSPYLKSVDEHNLQGQMHTVTGWIGKNEPFDQSKVQGRLALVNKDSDHLMEEYLIPIKWWAPRNNGMIRHKNGEWVLGQYDEPEPETFTDMDTNI